MKFAFLPNPEILNGNKVIIYGAGSAGALTLLALLQHNVRVDFFADSSSARWGEFILNKKVLSSDELIALKDECNIIIGSQHSKEIFDKLSALGFPNIYLGNTGDALCFDLQEGQEVNR